MVSGHKSLFVVVSDKISAIINIQELVKELIEIFHTQSP